MQPFVDALNSFFSGPVMVCGIAAVGLLLSIRTRFIQFSRLGYTLRTTFSQMFRRSGRGRQGITPFQAVTTALSGTLGTGNIAGVATAVSLGGAGAVFWMWVSAFFGMATKYGEIVLAMRTRRKRPDGSWAGGPMYYIEEAMGGRRLACAFAVFCLLSSFCMGNMVQSNTAAAAVAEISGMGPTSLRLLFLGVAAVVGFVIIGGIRRIARTTEALVPAMALFYLGGCLVVLCTHLPELADALGEIFAGAFSLRSAAGGASGYLMNRAIKIGFSKGVFTNEAGLGSAPIAHASAENDLPARQGLWGIFEVFLDTVVMCTLTGLVVIVSGFHLGGSANGAAITLAAFDRYLGGFASFLIGVSTVFFAVASIIGWAWYGETCVRYLFRSRAAVLCYKCCYVAAVYLGAVSAVELVWGLADVCNSLMMLPNLAGVVLLSGAVGEETRRLDEAIAAERRQMRGKKRALAVRRDPAAGKKRSCRLKSGR